MNTSLGYSKRTLDNTKVLLSGGGDKLLSDFIGSISWDAQNRKLKYTPVGGTATDLVTLGSNALNSTAYLPLSGGTIQASSDNATPLLIKSKGTGSNTIAYLGFVGNNDTTLGYIGYNAANTPVVRYSNNSYAIIHSGNISSQTVGTALEANKLKVMATISSDNTANYPWRLLAQSGEITANYVDTEATIVLRQFYNGGKTGTIKIAFRTNAIATTASSVSAVWLNRYGFDVNDVKIAVYWVANKSYADVFVRSTSWNRMEMHIIGNRSWSFLSSSEDKNGSNPVHAYTSIEAAATALHGQAYTNIVTAIDGGIVRHANYATQTSNDGDGNAINTTYLKLSGGTLTGLLTLGLDGYALRWGSSTNYSLGSNHDSDFYIWGQNSAAFRIGTNGAERIRVTGGGNVGIDIASPSYKLDVNGSANATTLYESGTSLASKYFHYLGGITDAYVNGTYSNINSGTYAHSRGGWASSLIHFHIPGSSVTGLDLYLNSYEQTASSPIQYRKSVDQNRFSGGWVTLIDSLNIGNYFKTINGQSIIGSGDISVSSGSGGYNGGNITGTFSSSNGVPLQFTGVGSGTYNVCQWYCQSNGITLETPRETDSPYATSLPFMVKTRGGQYGTLKAGDVWVDSTLYIKDGYGIESRPSGNGLLVYNPNSYTGVSSSQWGVGAVSCQGVIRSSNSDLIHYRYGADAYTIWDSYNFSPSSYLAKSGGTMSGAIKFRNDRTGIFDLGSNNTPSGYTTTSTGGNHIGITSWDGANDEGGILVGSDCCIIYNSSDSGYLFKVIDKDVSPALGNGFGESNVRFAITDSGECKMISNCYASNFYTTSDRNKKQNISSLSEHIRKFQLKSTEKWHYGVIALEVPEMFRDGEEGNMTVNYDSVLSYYVGLLENKVKELEDRIKELETRLEIR